MLKEAKSRKETVIVVYMISIQGKPKL